MHDIGCAGKAISITAVYLFYLLDNILPSKLNLNSNSSISSLTHVLQVPAQEIISVISSIGLNRIETQAEIKAYV